MKPIEKEGKQDKVGFQKEPSNIDK